MLKKSLPLLLICVVLLSGCAAKLVPLTLEDGKLLNKKQELSYTAAPLRYEATVQGEAYAYCKEEQLTLYAVEGADPTEWLTEEYTGSLTMLFCADSIKLPTFTELDAEKITVCTKGNITVGVMEITDREKIRAAAELFENGTAAEWPGVQSELPGRRHSDCHFGIAGVLYSCRGCPGGGMFFRCRLGNRFARICGESL